MNKYMEEWQDDIVLYVQCDGLHVRVVSSGIVRGGETYIQILSLPCTHSIVWCIFSF